VFLSNENNKEQKKKSPRDTPYLFYVILCEFYGAPIIPPRRKQPAQHDNQSPQHGTLHSPSSSPLKQTMPPKKAPANRG